MRRIISCLALGALLVGSVSLTGCIVAPRRSIVRARVVLPIRAGIWVPGYWGPSRVWVGGYWRRR